MRNGQSRECSFQNNKLSGSLVLKSLPSEIRFINAERNNFSAVAVIERKAHVRITLRGSGVTSVVDVNGRKRNMNRFLK